MYLRVCGAFTETAPVGEQFRKVDQPRGVRGGELVRLRAVAERDDAVTHGSAESLARDERRGEERHESPTRMVLDPSFRGALAGGSDEHAPDVVVLVQDALGVAALGGEPGRCEVHAAT